MWARIVNNVPDVDIERPVYSLDELVEEAKHQIPPDVLDDEPVGCELL